MFLLFMSLLLLLKFCHNLSAIKMVSTCFQVHVSLDLEQNSWSNRFQYINKMNNVNVFISNAHIREVSGDARRRKKLAQRE